MRSASLRTVRGARAQRGVAGRADGGETASRKEPRRASRLDALADELKETARGIGIRVRQERLMREVGYHAQSGLCRLEGDEILLLDHDLSSEGQVELLASVLATRDLAGVALSEEAARLLAAVSRAAGSRGYLVAAGRRRGANGRAPVRPSGGTVHG